MWRFRNGMILAIILCVSGALVLPAASPDGVAQAARVGAGGGVLRVGIVTHLETLDVQAATELTATQQDATMYDTLLRIDQNGHLQPGLATGWSVSPNGKVLSFTLRRGVKFSDGTPFDANAVKFNFERMFDPNNKYHKMGTFLLPSIWVPPLDHVQIIDRYHVRAYFKVGSGATIWNLSAVPGRMVSPTAVKKYGKSFPQHPTGTGPFTFVSLTSDGTLTLKRNPHYWGKEPSISELIITPIPDDQARITALETGRVDLIFEPSPDNLPSIRKRFRTTNVLLDHVANIGLDTSSKPFNNRLVRLAFSYAIDRKTLVTRIMNGIADVPKGTFPAKLWAFNPNIKGPFQYNPALAKRLLAQAGYPHGVDFKWLVPISGVASPEPPVWAAFVQADLAKVGLRAHIQKLDGPTTLNTELKGLKGSGFQAATIGWVILTADPDSWVYSAFATSSIPPGGFNFGYFRSTQANQALAASRHYVTNARRYAAYSNLQRVLAQQVPWVEVFNWRYWAAMSTRVKGLVMRPNGDIFYNYVTVQ